MLAFGVIAITTVVILLFGSFAAAVFFGHRFKLPPLTSPVPSTPEVPIPRTYWWLGLFAYGLVVPLIVAAQLHIKWLEYMFAWTFLVTWVVRVTIVVRTFRKDRRLRRLPPEHER
jgi:hypothetical protein